MQGEDLSGTLISGKGDCLPFAVFSGVQCANIPIDCGACDNLFHQLPPADFFGLNHFITPVNGPYTLRIIAIEDGTIVQLNNGPSIILNKTQYYSQNNLLDALHISSTAPVMVAQYLQGIRCSNSGDPAMAIISSFEQKTESAYFTTINTGPFNNHYIDIVVESSNVNNFFLDGLNIGAGFTPFPAAPNFAYKKIEIVPGAHLLSAKGGFTASVYGTGQFISYFYSTGIKGHDTKPKLTEFHVKGSLCSENPLRFFTQQPCINCFWDFGDGTSGKGNNVYHSYQNPGTYTVSLLPTELIKFCNSNDTLFKYIQIFESPLPVTAFTPDTAILLGTSTPLYASGGTSYTWSPSTGLSCTNCPNPIAAPQKTTTYYVTSKGENGCIAMDSVTVFVDTDLHIYIPNIFSPNGDGQNDVLYVEGKGIKKMQFYIYNRWGEKVFESNDLNKGWDGTYKGESLQPAVFVYMIDATLESGQKLVKKGDITLIK
jgi:gliding motility-associated-like protein